MKIQAVKGMKDILPPMTAAWQVVEARAALLFARYGFREIRTPLVESADLFIRSVGKETEVVQKQMYLFEDQKGARLCLRPEATASVVRAYIEGGLGARDPIAKLYYSGPMFRYEQPQMGRQRQFYQIGAELIGAAEPLADAEVMILLHDFFAELGVPNLSLEINSLGCATCRPGYAKALQDFFRGKNEKFCEDCQKRIRKNPLRVLDCKTETCHRLAEGVPAIGDFWCEECRRHFHQVRGLLVAGRVPFEENPAIVRGLDYYCRTAFEFVSPDLGAQNAVAAGGRYDGLVRELGGPDVPGVGFAIGIERLLILLGESFARKTGVEKSPVFFVLLGQDAVQATMGIVHELRSRGVPVEWGYGGSLKSQLRRANKIGAGRAVIVGENEVQKGAAVLKEMADGSQREVLLDRLTEHLS